MQFRSFLIGLLSLLLVISPVLAGTTSSPENDHAFAAIRFMQNLGVGRENFYPARPTTIAEFLTMGFLAAGVEKGALQNTTTRFSDVPIDSWFNPFVARAEQFDLLTDYKQRLLPNRPISRGEAVKLALRIFGISVPVNILKEKFGFSDARPRHRLAPYIFQAVKMGILNPVSDTEFGTTRKLTRAKTAQLFYDLTNFESANKITIIPSGSFRHLTNIPKISLLETVWREVKERFLFDKNIDETEMLYRAIQGAVESLDDPYSVFLPPKKSQSFEDGISGELEGIGAYLNQDKKTGEITIVAPIKDTPADKAGLKPGDVITAIDDKPTSGHTLSEIVGLIKGPVGTPVNIKIKRKGQELNFRIVRAKIKVTSVTVKYRNNIAIISVSQFGGTTAKEFAAVAEDVSKANLRGIVLDLRNNPGGLLNTAIDMLGYFLPKDSIAAKARYRADVNSRDLIYRTKREPLLANFRVVVLVNKGSASASEIVASTLQDYKRAILVGKKTFGKGTMQELSFFVDGTALKLTVAHWLSPNEQPIDKNGVKPDIDIEDNEHTDLDEQLQKALSLF